MKILLKNTKEQIELIKAMASSNREVAFEARAALATFLGPVLTQVINNAPTLSNIFTTHSYVKDSNPSLPLDLYYDIFDEKYINVWSQSVPGGLPQNIVQPSASELKFAPYTLDCAVAFDKKYANQSRLDVVSKSFTRLLQEVLLKQERTSANLVLTSAANGQTGGSAATFRHVFRSAAPNRFVLEDLNKMFTKIKRINASFVGGTPSGARRGITDLIISPEITEELRAMAYNPVNTKIAPVAAASTSYTAGNAPITAPDSVRNQIFNQSGLPEFFGVALMEINEFGVGRRFNTIFDTVAGATTYSDHSSIQAYGGTATAFDGAAEEILLGIDRSRDSLIQFANTEFSNLL
jgi:hypothetical protein